MVRSRAHPARVSAITASCPRPRAATAAASTRRWRPRPWPARCRSSPRSPAAASTARPPTCAAAASTRSSSSCVRRACARLLGVRIGARPPGQGPRRARLRRRRRRPGTGEAQDDVPLLVTVPTRRRDVTRPVDLIEEAGARLRLRQPARRAAGHRRLGGHAPARAPPQGARPRRVRRARLPRVPDADARRSGAPGPDLAAPAARRGGGDPGLRHRAQRRRARDLGAAQRPRLGPRCASRRTTCATGRRACACSRSAASSRRAAPRRPARTRRCRSSARRSPRSSPGRATARRGTSRRRSTSPTRRASGRPSWPTSRLTARTGNPMLPAAGSREKPQSYARRFMWLARGGSDPGSAGSSRSKSRSTCSWPTSRRWRGRARAALPVHAVHAPAGRDARPRVLPAGGRAACDGRLDRCARPARRC